jgi:hypothetical protein
VIQQRWSEIIAEEHRRHPCMTAQDLHKLLAQACLGGDHLLHNAEAFREGLAREWDRWSGGEDEGVCSALQIIHPAGMVARLHLRRCHARGIPRRDIERLLLAQPMRAGSPDALAWAWASVLHSARHAEIPFSLEQLSEVRPSADVPRHSPFYGPASYRIVNDLRHLPTRETLRRLDLL